MKAVYMCEDLMKFITEEKQVEGHVHSVFRNAFNIEAKDKFFTILNKNKFMAPMSLTIDYGENSNFISEGIKLGFKVEINVNDIICKEADILIDLHYAKGWSSEAVLKTSELLEENVLVNLKLIENNLKKEGRLYGIGTLINILNEEMPELNLTSFSIDYPDNNLEFIRKRFIKFIKAVKENDIENIACAAEKVIGYGVGLTPSMDDFISGIMISYIYLGNFYNLNMTSVYEFNNKLIQNGHKKTTKVSSEMLKHSCNGKANEAVRQLIFSIINDLDKKKIIKALINTINFGETSGTDTALGIYVGCKIMTNLRYRRFWLNETMH